MKKAYLLLLILALLLSFGVNAFSAIEQKLVLLDEPIKLKYCQDWHTTFEVPDSLSTLAKNFYFIVETEGKTNLLSCSINGNIVREFVASQSGAAQFKGDNFKGSLHPGTNLLRIDSAISWKNGDPYPKELKKFPDSASLKKAIQDGSLKLPDGESTIKQITLVFVFLEQDDLPPTKQEFNYSVNWAPGLMHVHTDLSDGIYSMERVVKIAKDNGLKFIGVTDHLEKIDPKNPLTGKADPNQPEMQKYFRDIKSLSNKDFAVFQGTEIMEKYKKNGLTRSSHSLAFVKPVVSVYHKIGELKPHMFKMDGQQELLGIEYNFEMLSIAAHPFLSSYPYDTRATKFLNGVGFFNNDGSKFQDEIDFYMKFMKERRNVFAVSCSDYHGYPKISAAALKRITWIYDITEGGCGPDKGQLIYSLIKGKTYAANNGAVIVHINHIPQFAPYTTDSPTFNIVLKFDDNKKHRCMLYRNGEKISKSEKDIRSGDAYYFTDKEVMSRTGNTYNFVCPGYIVTSPILLYISD